MSINPNERIIIPDDDGVEHYFNVIYKFDIDELEQTYVIVAPVDEQENDEEEEIEVYAFRFEENKDKAKSKDDFHLYSIETDEEWDLVEEMLYILQTQNDTT